MTVKKLYRMKEAFGAGDWCVVAMFGALMTVQHETTGIIVHVGEDDFRAMYQEYEMRVEMTAGDVEREREAVRESQEILRNGEYT
jgi:hypothetical protein